MLSELNFVREVLRNFGVSVSGRSVNATFAVEGRIWQFHRKSFVWYFLGSFWWVMVRSTLLCRLSWGALRAENPVQRKCIFTFCARGLHWKNQFQMMFSRSNLNSSIFNDADSWRHDRKLLNFDIQFPGIFAHVTPLLRQPAKVENPFENNFSGMFRNVLVKNGAQHSPLSFVLGSPSGRKYSSTQMYFYILC